MMAAALLSVGIGGAATAAPVNDFIPEPKDFRSQEIHRVRGETDWPFVAEKGLLLCAPSWENRFVYFVPEDEEGESEYPFALHENMMTVALVNLGRNSVLRPFDNFEQLVKRLSPYLAMGKRLCDQPAGAKLRDTAL